MNREVNFGVRLARVLGVSARKIDVDQGRFVYPLSGKSVENDVLLTPYEKIDWNTIKDCVLEAEKLGYDSVISPDHCMTGRGLMDCLAILGALAGVTSKIKLGTMTTNSMRYLPSPALFIKQIATLDYLTGGRIFPLGLGAGYMREEYEAYGFPFQPTPVRIQQLKETVEIMRKMFTEAKASYKGKYFEIKDAVCEPKPVQNPFPICVGGAGPNLLKMAARHADMVNLEMAVNSADEESLLKETKRLLSFMEQRFKEAGRNWETDIVKSWSIWFWLYEDERERKEHAEAFKNGWPRGMLMGTPEEITGLFEKLVELGISFFTLRFEDLPSKRGLHLFAEKVMPAFR